MIVIADSGSSKTDWLFIGKDKEISLESPGINPFFQNSEQVFTALSSALGHLPVSEVNAVYFYGAGCIKKKTDQVVHRALSLIFTNAHLEIEDDMLGGARALLGKQPGIACILGTGANSCFYNGEIIEDKVPTLGFILGDEGSGAHLGKLFLNDYFKRALPQELKNRADSNLQLNMPEVLAAVYRGEYPSRYLAGFSKFLKQNIAHVYIRNLVKRGFSEFFFRNVERYENYKSVRVSFVGSIAFFYADILKEVAVEREIQIGKIVEKPIEGLKHFHSNLNKK
ncbi:ATPase [uncultured Draconibacterium sp.]|uniref:ATPase n=1 Tax=uncultured Draconibacterium sp. TaxID=1573823 RepID=UPI0025FEA60F|nr:ATPase [uncultured Draconibacterium sp.]